LFPQNSRIRKAWIMKTASKVLLALAVLGGLVIVAGGAAFVVLSLDESPPDDSDLRVERLDIPDDQNAFTYFEQVAQVLYWPGYEPPEDEDEEERDEVSDDAEAKAEQEKKALLDRMLEGETWDENLATEILERNEETFVLFEKGLACPHFQVPRAEGIDADVSYAFGYLALARLHCLRALALVKEGHEERAFEEAMKVVRFGHRIEGAKGGLITYFIGLTVKGLGVDMLRELVSESSLPPDRLKVYADRLASLGPNEEGLADTLRCEYEWEIGILEDFRAGKHSLDEFRDGGEERGRPKQIPTSFVFKPNETRRLCAEMFRPIIDNVPKPYVEMQPREKPWPEEWGTLRCLLSGNAVGKMLYSVLVPATKQVLELKVRAKTEVAATRLLIAMKAYKMEQGRLPETLEELVPEYIDAVPLDDFDGKPMRYNPGKRVIYSVGEDLKDDGGMTKEEQEVWWKEEGYKPDVWDMPDPSFPIEF